MSPADLRAELDARMTEAGRVLGIDGYDVVVV